MEENQRDTEDTVGIANTEAAGHTEHIVVAVAVLELEAGEYTGCTVAVGSSWQAVQLQPEPTMGAACTVGQSGPVQRRVGPPPCCSVVRPAPS